MIAIEIFDIGEIEEFPREKRRGRPPKVKTPEELAKEAEPPRPRGRPKLTEEEKASRKVKCAPGELSEQIDYAVAITKFGKIDSNDPKQVKKRINEYFAHCHETDTMPTKPGLALALCTNSKELDKWLKKTSKKPYEVVELVTKAADIIANLVEQLATKGKMDKAFSMFTLKSNFDYRESSEVVIAPKNPLEDGANLAKIAEKYSKSIVDDNIIEVDYRVIEDEPPEIEPPKLPKAAKGKK